jgi:hypothetical protein
MNWNEWEAVWKRQEPPRGAAADLATLRETFAAKSRKSANALLRRDVLEASGGLAVCVTFAGMWWMQGRAGWPIGVAIILVAGVTGFFVRERMRTHRTRLGAEAPMLARLEAEITELHHQRRLLLGIWKWYLAPIGAAIVIVCLTITRSRPVWDLSRGWPFLGSYFVFCLLLFVAVWALNRRAVRVQIEPRLAELEKLKSDLLSP